MKRPDIPLPVAILASAVIVAATIAFTFRWEAGGGFGGVIFRLDRWTGVIVACRVPVQASLYGQAAPINCETP